jgi:putative addiction module CopG family antidote
MNLTLKPKTMKFLQEQVKSGRYGSAEEVLQEALDRFMFESNLELDAETVAKLKRSEARIERGEGMSFKKFAAEARRLTATK